MTGIKIRDLRSDLTFGSEVSGLNWGNVEDEAVRVQLRELFKERGLLVFKDMEPTAKMQVAMSLIFGPLKDHPTKTTPRDVNDEDVVGVIDMHYIPNVANGYGSGMVEVDGIALTRFSPWHFDHCYNDELNYAGVLRSPVSTPERGRTGFMDGVELYRQFSPELRELIEGKNIIYTLDTRLSKMRFGVNFKVLGGEPTIVKELLKEVAIFPRAMHPAVWTLPSGEKSLHVSPWMAVGIEHHENPESDAQFDAVCHEINRLGKGTSAFWHDWSPNDMLIWDNTRMMHAVEGCDPKYERHTIRSTISGDYGLGYFEDGKKIGEVFREVA
jgi:taurine dioxygenase